MFRKLQITMFIDSCLHCTNFKTGGVCKSSNKEIPYAAEAKILGETFAIPEWCPLPFDAPNDNCIPGTTISKPEVRLLDNDMLSILRTVRTALKKAGVPQLIEDTYVVKATEDKSFINLLLVSLQYVRDASLTPDKIDELCA